MPQKHLQLVDTVALLVTLVVGIGVFKMPALVAAQSTSEPELLLIWITGGCLTLIGALCYAELGNTYPESRGEFDYIRMAYGQRLAILFGWSRFSVIQTGSIALTAFIFGDYMAQTLPFHIGPGHYAMFGILTLTAINLAGIRPGKWMVNGLATLKITGIILLIVSGIVLGEQFDTASSNTSINTSTNYPLALVFVMLAYGGWSELSYMTRDMNAPKQQIGRALLIGMGVISSIYLMINLAYLNVLGLSELGRSVTPANDLVRHLFGNDYAHLFSGFIALCAFGVMNATIITGSRSTFAFSETTAMAWHPLLRCLTDQASALIYQCIAALLLVGFGSLQRDGFETMIAFTAPVFWFFLFLSTLSLIVLRLKDGERPRQLLVPFYPLPPLIFGFGCLFMLYSSIRYAGIGALVGVAVLLSGLPFIFRPQKRKS